MRWRLEVMAARFVSALNYIRERLCSGVGEGGSKIGREGGREGERLKLGGGGGLRRGSGMSKEERIYKAGFN